LNSLGTKSLQEILSDRESIAQTMQVDIKRNEVLNDLNIIFQAALDEGTEGWGVRVERVEV
jgi:regulator of protease activity HflC (stomatin/prohibitin superfamily)